RGHQGVGSAAALVRALGLLRGQPRQRFHGGRAVRCQARRSGSSGIRRDRGPQDTLLECLKPAAERTQQSEDSRATPLSEWRRVATLEGHSGTVYDVALSADGQLLASGGTDGMVRLWEAVVHVRWCWRR